MYIKKKKRVSADFSRVPKGSYTYSVNNSNPLPCIELYKIEEKSFLLNLPDFKN